MFNFFIKIPSSVSSKITWEGLSKPNFRAISIGIISGKFKHIYQSMYRSYTQLIEKRYMSEIWPYRKMPLGDTEAYFIGAISVSEKSAYDIFLGLRNLTLEKKNLMAYKNVHKRIKTLEKLALIEPVEGKFRRNAIKYRLTPYGLFQRLLTSSSPFDYTPPSVLEPYMKKNPVMQTILYQYFEEETVKAFLDSQTYSMLLADYLRETCEVILRKLEEWRLVHTKISPMMNYGMDEVITIKAKNFITQIVIFLARAEYSKLDITQDRSPEEQVMGDEYVNVIRTLAKDQKFIKLLMKMRDEFGGGCEIFL
jgi:hypothetical protein